MALTADIAESYRAPGRVLRRRLAAGGQEAAALATLFGAALLSFLAQWPSLAREAQLHPEVPFDARLGGALMATVFLMPLLAYAVAALSHLIARAVGGRGSWFGARMALFWALLAASPMMLLQGALAGVVGPGAWQAPLGLAVLAGFLWLWLGGLRAAERGAG